MPDQPRPSFQFRNVLLPVIILALPILAYFGWEYQQAKATPENVKVDTLTAYLKRMTPTNKLSEKFVDNDGDLVADGPNHSDWKDPEQLVFCPGLINADEKESDWQPLMDHFATVTGKKVIFSKLDSPTEILDQLTDGKIHITSFSTGSVPTAVNKAGFVPAVALASDDGAYTYAMEIIVPAKSDIKAPTDLKGKTIALVIASSHSGYKAPLIIFDDEFHMRPIADYKFVISGSHQGSINMLAQGRAEAAAVAADVLADTVATEKPFKADDYRVIYKSKPFPKGTWGYSCLLKPKLGGKIREAFVTLSFAGTQLTDKFKGSKAVKFVPINYKKDWDYVREIDARILAWK